MISRKLPFVVLAFGFAACQAADGTDSSGTGSAAGAAATASGGAAGRAGSGGGGAGASGTVAMGGAAGTGAATASGGTGQGAGGAAGAAANSGGGGSGGGSGELCAERAGGALLELEIKGVTLRVWVTNAGFIAEMEAGVGGELDRIPLFELLDGRDCDPQWTWHVDPASARFVDTWIDLCDEAPDQIEREKEHYLANGDYCPTEVTVLSVERR